jgi:hypothetical protein
MSTLSLRFDRVIRGIPHKFGLKLPNTVEEALEIDWRTGTNFWQKAIKKEMRNVMVAFDIHDDGEVPVGFKEISCHLVFNVKRDSWQRVTSRTLQRSRLIPVLCHKTLHYDKLWI